MSSSKKMTCKVILRQVFICMRPRTLYLPPYTLYAHIHLYSICTVLIQIVRGGGVESERRGEGQHRRVQIPKLGWKWLIVHKKLSINSDKHLPQSPFTGQFFLDDNILHCILWVLSFNGRNPAGSLYWENKSCMVSSISYKKRLWETKLTYLHSYPLLSIIVSQPHPLCS
jgi:hypothetical protein